MKKNEGTAPFYGAGFSSWKKNALCAGLSMTLLFAALPAVAGNPAQLNEAEKSMAVDQASQVSGIVLDENGDALIGASVIVKGTQNGAATDMDGKFSLKANPGATLVISYMGYETMQVKAGRAPLKVNMKPEDNSLDELVVIGYGAVKKRDLTGSVASVKSDDITRTPTSNPLEAIQGQVAGLDITRTSGDAGGGVSMVLRGNRSLNGSNEPLFIIDGMVGKYEELNPNDIASIEVLKDASSTAVYGAAGANGVVIITTKSPKKNKFSIDFDAYYGWNVITSFPEVNRGQKYIDFRRQALINGGEISKDDTTTPLFPAYMQKFIDNNQWVDWYDLASQTGTTQSYNLSTSYSNDRVTSYFSLGYYDQEGLLKGDELQRYSARAKVDFKANNILKYGINLYAMYSNNDKRYSRIWNRVLCMPPLGEPYDANGKLVDYPLGDGNMTPIADNQSSSYVNNIKRISVTPQMYFELTPIKGLSFKSILGGYFSNSRQGMYIGPKSYQGLESGKVYAQIPNRFTYNYMWQNILTYNFNIKKQHDFTVTAVSEWQKNRSESATATGNGFDSDNYKFYNLGASTGTPEVSSGYVQRQAMSYVGRINYSYLGRYLITLNARVDGDSRLAKGHKWDIFPGGAVAWRISDEAFMKNIKEISNLKFRASYGVTGSAGADEYATQAVTRTGLIGFQDTPLSYSGYGLTLGNDNLGWEKTYMTDLGLDLGLLKERISFTFDWYDAITKDVLYQKNMPYEIGGAGATPFNLWSNVGKTRNTGVEIGITSRNFVGPKFTWTTTLQFAANHERVVRTTSDGPLQFNDYYLIKGQPMKTYYGYKYMGIWGTAQAEEAAKYGQKPGQVHIEDKSDDGKFSSADYEILGSATPKWSGSLFNSFTYKGFDLSVLLIMRWDWTINYGVTGWYRTDGLTPSPTICDYWTEENQGARYPAPNSSISNGQDQYQQWANYFDGSYLKVKNITLGYTLPKTLTKKVGIQKARVYFTADNPFIFTKCKYLKNYDPEKGGNDDEAPLSKQFVFGVNVSF